MKMKSNRGMTGIEFGERRDLGWMCNAPAKKKKKKKRDQLF